MILDLAMPVTAVNQTFHDGLGGEPIAIFSVDCPRDQSYLTGYQTDLDPHTAKELMLDVNKILAGACLYGVCNSEELSAILTPHPSLVTENTAEYSQKRHNFVIHPIIMMVEGTLGSVRQSLDSQPASV